MKSVFTEIGRLIRAPKSTLRKLAQNRVRGSVGTVLGAAMALVAGFGVFGALLGGLLGFLVDELISRLNRIDRFFDSGMHGGLDRRAAQLASIAALCVSLLRRVGHEPTTIAVELAKLRIGQTLQLNRIEHETLGSLVDRVSTRERVETKGICESYRSLSNLDEREGVVRLLYLVAPGDGELVTSDQDEFVGLVSGFLGLERDQFDAIRNASNTIADTASRLLGVESGASLDEIRRVYRHLAAQFHPDAGIDLPGRQRRLSQEAFVRIQDAYDRIVSERTAQSKTDDA